MDTIKCVDLPRPLAAWPGGNWMKSPNAVARRCGVSGSSLGWYSLWGTPATLPSPTSKRKKPTFTIQSYNHIVMHAHVVDCIYYMYACMYVHIYMYECTSAASMSMWSIAVTEKRIFSRPPGGVL